MIETSNLLAWARAVIADMKAHSIGTVRAACMVVEHQTADPDDDLTLDEIDHAREMRQFYEADDIDPSWPDWTDLSGAIANTNDEVQKAFAEFCRALEIARKRAQ